MRLIDADILEREGWYLSRNYDVDSETRCFESKAIKKVPTAHPELNEWCHECKEYDPEKGCCPRWGQVIRTALEDAKPEQRWVSCSERLPEPDQICIVTDDERLGAYEYGFHSENHDEIDGWTFLGRKIIAWMPLPEPYKGE